MYDVQLDGEEVHSRWLAEFDPDAQAEVVPKFHYYDISPWDGLVVPPRAHVRDFGFLVLMAVAFWFFVMLWVLRHNVPPGMSGDWWLRKVRDFGFAGLVVVLWFRLSDIDFNDPALLPVLFASLRSALDAFVGGSVIGWIVLDIAAVLGCLAILGWRIERIETPKQKHWGFTRKPISAY